MPAPGRVVAGDAVIASGSLGDHGMAVMAARYQLPLRGDLASDVAPLGPQVMTVSRPSPPSDTGRPSAKMTGAQMPVV